jgi:hypothetical protein
MAVGEWKTDEPSGSTLVSQVDDQICDDKTTLLNALGKEHKFEESDTTCNHLEGSARAWVDVEANRSLRDSSRGRLFVETDTLKLYYGDTEDAWAWLAPKRNVVRCSFTPVTQITWATPTFANITFITADITTVGGELLITCTVTVKNNVSGKLGYLVLAVDDKAVTDADNGSAVIEYHSGDDQTITLTRLVKDTDNGIDLSAGTHTVTLKGKVDTDGQCELVQNVNIALNIEEV